MSKLSVHAQSIPGWLEELRDAGATSWKCVDPPTTDPCPGLACIGRIFREDGYVQASINKGAVGADEYFQELLPIWKARPWVHAWELCNEPGVGSPQDRANLVAWTIRLADLAHGAGLRVVGLCISVGQPDIGLMAEFGPVMSHLDYWALHEYDYPTVLKDGWRTLRYRKSIAELAAAGYTDLPPLLLTECGIDGGCYGKPRAEAGWRATGISAGDYFWAPNQLGAYSDELDKDAIVQAAYIFTEADPGLGFNWDSFHLGQDGGNRLVEFVSVAEPKPLPLRPGTPNPIGYTLPTYEPLPIDQMAYGMDISKYRYPIDWDLVKAEVDAGRLHFCLIRATGPNVWPNPTHAEVDMRFEEHYTNAVRVGLRVGAYAYVFDSPNVTPTEQAQKLYDVCLDKDLPLGPWGDAEAAGVSDAEWTEFFNEADRLFAVPVIEGTKPTGCYSGAWYLDKFGKPAWAKDRLRWVANWTTHDHPVMPKVWTEWDIWQWTSKGEVPGVPPPTDLNRFHGTPALLAEMFPKSEEGEQPPMSEVKVIDMTGAPRDMAWVQSKYGAVTIEPPAGLTEFYDVVQLQEVTGIMAFQAILLDANGNPVNGERMVYSYPGSPAQPGSGWDNCGAVEVTGKNQPPGVAEHSAGGGEGYNPPTKGPVSWYHWGGDSARISGLGWLGFTNHDHLQVTFKWKGESSPPDPGECDCLKSADATTMYGELMNKLGIVEGKVDAVLAKLG